MTTLLSQPPELIEDCLFPFLHWNDLLRLRRVSKTSKALVQDYVQANPSVAPEIEIGGKETERNVKAFLDLNLPSTKIFLNNEWSGSSFYEDNLEELTRFLEVCGSVVTHLRVHHFSLYCSNMERTVLEGLVNLQSFEAKWFDTTKNENGDMLPVPSVFGNVTVLKLRKHGNGQYQNVPTGIDGLNGYIELLNECQMLETLAPLTSYSYDNNSLVSKLIRFLDAAFQQRDNSEEASTLSKLKVIDLEFKNLLENDEVWEDDKRARAENDYRQFLKSCAIHGILVRGVDMNANDCLKDFAWNTGHLLMPLASLSLKSRELYNWAWAMEMEMPVLDSLKLHTFRYNGDEEEDLIDNDNHRVVSRTANWPMLKSLDLHVALVCSYKMSSRDRSLAEKYPNYARLLLRETQDLFRLFFEGIIRTALTDLSLSFSTDNDILTAETLSTCCPNLTKLKLCRWGANNEQFVRLWEKLPNLEEIELRLCYRLGDDGFIGPDKQNPIFCNLKKLRKLTLDIFIMQCCTPGITDILFSTVLRHMSLTHFKCISEEDNKNVTKKGIESLLGAQFEMSIQKLSFRWYLPGPGTMREDRNLQELFAHRLTNMV